MSVFVWRRSLFIVLLAAILSLILSIALLSAVPPVSKDALVHHLAVPNLYLRHGGMYEIPFMPFSYYPMNLDLLYMIPLYFGNDILPKFMHFCFALLTAWLIYDYLKRRLDKVYALFGVLFFLSIPIIIRLSISVYVDLGLVFFSTASLLLLFRWVESGFRSKFLLLAAVCCGLAVGTRYNGLITLLLLTLFVPIFYSRKNKDKHPGFFRPLWYGVIFCFTALLIFSPWMVRNVIWKNNPIYPFYNHWFNPPAKQLNNNAVTGSDEVKANRGFFTRRSLLYNESWWEIALLPVRIFFEGKDGSPRYFDGRLNPFLLFLPFFAFFRVRGDPIPHGYEKKAMLWFSLVFFGMAFFTFLLRVRYVLPIIPFLVILAVFGANNIIKLIGLIRSRTVKRAFTALFFSFLAISLALNAVYLAGKFRQVAPFKYISGELSRDEYITRYRPEYPAMKFISNNLPPDALVMFVFLGKRGYYCNREFVPDTESRIKRLYRLIKNSKEPDDIRLSLKHERITHLAIYVELFERWVSRMFDSDKYQLLNDFFRTRTKLLYSGSGVAVFEILPSH